MAKKIKYLRVFTILLILAGIALIILKNEAAQFVFLAGSLLGIYLATKNTEIKQ